MWERLKEEKQFNLGGWEGFPEEVALELRSKEWSSPQVLGEVKTLLAQIK